MDTLSPQQRSENMSRVRGRDTSPERLVRRLAHKMGYRFRLHDGKLPGRPDLVFPARRKVILVHGCFWHQHKCARGRRPSSNIEFWDKKLDGNADRDRRVKARLRRAGWRVLVVWECGTKDEARLRRRLAKFLAE